MEENKKEPCKKCFCSRCFLPVEKEDRVDIEGQSFHRHCSMCCVCRTIPTSLKMFYGHVFCAECFKTHVLSRFRGEGPKIHSNSWWMQWAPGTKPAGAESNDDTETEAKPKENVPEEPHKRCICARCLQAVDSADKIDIDGQSFHPQCCRCYFCHCVPKSNLKIYYGQVFCEECFHRHVLHRGKDNPTEFFRNCFEQWNNPQFADNMRQFMTSNSKESAPFVFMMQPFCRCGGEVGDQQAEGNARKSATPASVDSESTMTWDLSFENRAEDMGSDLPEVQYTLGSPQDFAAEKIEKLTKYLDSNNNNNDKLRKKWKNFIDYDGVSFASDVCGVVKNDCPKCLWQCGPIYVDGESVQKEVSCGNVDQ